MLSVTSVSCQHLENLWPPFHKDVANSIIKQHCCDNLTTFLHGYYQAANWWWQLPFLYWNTVVILCDCANIFYLLWLQLRTQENSDFLSNWQKLEPLTSGPFKVATTMFQNCTLIHHINRIKLSQIHLKIIFVDLIFISSPFSHFVLLLFIFLQILFRENGNSKSYWPPAIWYMKHKGIWGIIMII